MQNKNSIAKKFLVAILVLGISLSSSALYVPKTASAQATVPINTGLNFHSIQDNMKNFVWDKLAVLVANQILQKMTASIVSWINTGFEGSPAFITDPKGFFLDAADQITGEFLDKNGILGQMCSPFSFDLRLNLALNQSVYKTKRYDCTLGKIINNTRNAVNTAGQNSGITISGDPNGATIGNFVNGDFSQGGWEGFIAYSTEPQNNPIGATLMAQSDLRSRINEKKSNINADLNRGQGFMSWQKCTDVTSQYTSPELGGAESLGVTSRQEGQLRQFGNQTAVTGVTSDGTEKPTSVQKKVDSKTGMVSYQDCQTQTPGSLIGGSLQSQLDVPKDKLVLVKTISDSIDAILGALVNQMLTQGLGALSNRGSGTNGSQSYLVQLQEEAAYANGTQSQNSNAIINVAKNNAIIYSRTVELLSASKNDYLIAKECFINKIATRPLLDDAKKKYGQDQIAAIDLIITRDIDPLIATTTLKKILSQRQALEFETLLSSVTSFDTLNSAVDATAITTQIAIDNSITAPKEYDAIKIKTDAFGTDAIRFNNLCVQYPDSITNRTGR